MKSTLWSAVRKSCPTHHRICPSSEPPPNDGVTPASVTYEQALLLVGGELLGRRDEFVHRRRRLHARLVQNALAVVEDAGVVHDLDAVILPVDRGALDVGCGVVGLGVADDVVEGNDLLAPHGVDVHAALEDVRSRIREQTAVQLRGVVTGGPLHLHGGSGVFLGVTDDRLLGAGLAVLVVPLVDRRLAARATRTGGATGDPRAAPAARGEQWCGSSGGRAKPQCAEDLTPGESGEVVVCHGVLRSVEGRRDPRSLGCRTGRVGSVWTTSTRRRSFSDTWNIRSCNNDVNDLRVTVRRRPPSTTAAHQRSRWVG
jgi:hypothetical protein